MRRGHGKNSVGIRDRESESESVSETENVESKNHQNDNAHDQRSVSKARKSATSEQDQEIDDISLLTVLRNDDNEYDNDNENDNENGNDNDNGNDNENGNHNGHASLDMNMNGLDLNMNDVVQPDPSLSNNNVRTNAKRNERRSYIRSGNAQKDRNESQSLAPTSNASSGYVEEFTSNYNTWLKRAMETVSPDVGQQATPMIATKANHIRTVLADLTSGTVKCVDTFSICLILDLVICAFCVNI